MNNKNFQNFISDIQLKYEKEGLNLLEEVQINCNDDVSTPMVLVLLNRIYENGYKELSSSTIKEIQNGFNSFITKNKNRYTYSYYAIDAEAELIDEYANEYIKKLKNNE